MTQHLSLSQELIEMSSIMLKVCLAFGGAERENDWMVISQLSFLLSTERSYLVETHVIKKWTDNEGKAVEVLFILPVLSLDSGSPKVLLLSAASSSEQILPDRHGKRQPALTQSKVVVMKGQTSTLPWPYNCSPGDQVPSVWRHLCAQPPHWVRDQFKIKHSKRRLLRIVTNIKPFVNPVASHRGLWVHGSIRFCFSSVPNLYLPV